MKKTSKLISAFMAAILCFNLMPFSAFAAESPATEISFSAADLETYNQELADLGLNNDEIQQLQNITSKIANATTMREVDALMKSYHAILESTPLAAATNHHKLFRRHSNTGLYWQPKPDFQCNLYKSHLYGK